MGGDDFFDEFGKGEGLFTSEEEHARIREVLLAGAPTPGGDGDATAATSLQNRFCAVLNEMAAGKYPSLEAAQVAHPLDPYLRAAQDPAALESMRAEAAAASKCAELQKEGEAAAGGKGTWEPPPEDEEPETAQDYE
jgi:hypothetical protein